MSTLYEAYIKYKAYGWNGSLGNILFNSPWANPSDSRLKPVAFQGGDLGYTSPSGWTVEGADMLTMENRTSSQFTHQTLLTSYPAGGGGLASNIIVPGGQGISTNGFTYAKAGYASPMGFSVNGYFYNVSDLVNQWWFDGKYTFNAKGSICAVHRAAGRYREQRGTVVHRQDRQPSLWCASRRNVREELPADVRLRSDSMAHRLGLSAEERHLQQLELPDHAQARRSRISCRSTRRSASRT